MSESDYSTSHRLTNCPRCDYSLLGLPNSGICPECGQPYATHEIYLYGNATGTKISVWNAYTPGLLAPISTLLVVTICCYIFFWPGRFTDPDPLFFFCLVLLAAGSVISIWRRFTDQGSGVVQVRLTPFGVRQGTRGIGPKPYEANMDGKLIPWTQIGEAELAWRDGNALIRLSTPKSFFRYYKEYVHATFSIDREHFHDLRNYLRYWLTQNNSFSAIDFLERRRRPIHRKLRWLGSLLRKQS
jgi:hypothetical protein